MSPGRLQKQWALRSALRQVRRHHRPVHGRAVDVLNLASGRRATVLQVDRCFAGLEGFAHYQLSELNGGQWLMRFVPDAAPPSHAVLQKLRSRLSNMLELRDSAQLGIESAPALMAENSGKFRLVYPATRVSR